MPRGARIEVEERTSVSTGIVPWYLSPGVGTNVSPGNCRWLDARVAVTRLWARVRVGGRNGRVRRNTSEKPSGLLNPLGEPAAVLFEKKCSHAKTLAENSM